MRYVCVNKCFFRKRVWKIGETIDFSDKINKKLIPPHFIPENKYKKDVELSPKEADARARQAVGHNDQTSSMDEDILS